MSVVHSIKTVRRTAGAAGAWRWEGVWGVRRSAQLLENPQNLLKFVWNTSPLQLPNPCESDGLPIRLEK